MEPLIYVGVGFVLLFVIGGIGTFYEWFHKRKPDLAPAIAAMVVVAILMISLIVGLTTRGGRHYSSDDDYCVGPPAQTC